MKKPLTPREALYRLTNHHGVTVHTRTFERWMSEAKTPAKKFMGRVYFDEDEFDGWVKAQFKPLTRSLVKPLSKRR